MSRVEVSLEESYESLKSVSVDEDSILSFDERIKELELELDLKEYYDIKRPTIVFFGGNARGGHQVNVTRYDLLSETAMQAEIRQNALSSFGDQLLNEKRGWKALSHPSNNSIFLVSGGDIYLFDNQNELILKKRGCNLTENMRRQAICYNEGFIYMLGGYCEKENKLKRSCHRYNIVSEKWQ